MYHLILRQSNSGHLLFLIKHLLFAVGVFFSSWLGFAQRNCTYNLRGKITSADDSTVLAHANIYIEEEKINSEVDDKGHFYIQHLCPRQYHFHISHLGYVEKIVIVNIDKTLDENKFWTFELNPQHHILDHVVIRALDIPHKHDAPSSLSERQIKSIGHKDISDVFKKIAGVQVLRSGVGISKPIVQGMYGHRLEILNHNAIQSGQEWGNDHAPEIDVYSSNHVELISGGKVVLYSSSVGANLLSVEPESIVEDQHLRLSGDYILSSNDVGHSVHLGVEKHNALLPFRINLSGKKRGDSKTPNYFLTNTGKEEWSGNILLQKIRKKFDISFYYNLFYTKIGILRGSHISNLTDLQAALTRPQPFFTNEQFSYDISAPKQEVSHHLLTTKINLSLIHKLPLTIFYAFQFNDRKEFDIRRGGRTTIPSLFLKKSTHHLDLKFETPQLLDYVNIHAGLFGRWIENRNQYETGILPLIPDYNNAQLGYFLYLYSNANRSFVFTGGYRHELQLLNASILTNTNSGILANRRQHIFGNYLISVDMTAKPLKNIHTTLGIAVAERSPSINELYSQGLHQGIAGIEEGNDSLRNEFGIKFFLLSKFNFKKKWHFHTHLFYHLFSNYIYLQPQAIFRLTIRGAFPVYEYQQQDAHLYGGDIRLAYIADKCETTLKYSTAQGIFTNNISAYKNVVNMPSDIISLDFSYQILPTNSALPLRWSINGEYVFKQTHISKEQDFLEPPDGYFILNSKIETSIYFHKGYTLDVILGGENLLNHRYRNYLNRLRYFADEAGWNFTLGLHFKWL